MDCPCVTPAIVYQLTKIGICTYFTRNFFEVELHLSKKINLDALDQTLQFFLVKRMSFEFGQDILCFEI